MMVVVVGAEGEGEGGGGVQETLGTLWRGMVTNMSQQLHAFPDHTQSVVRLSVSCITDNKGWL